MRKAIFLTALLGCTFLLKAQKSFLSLDHWLEDHVQDLGGRAVLIIYKDGKEIYKKSENELTRRQKIARKMMARRQGKSASESVQNFDENTRQRIASCSKWLSAALVMTFVDEGKLHINDTIGKFLPVMTANGKGSITIAQCLSHLTGIKQTGLGEVDEEMERGTETLGRLKKLNKNMASMDAAMDSIAKLPMEDEPGKTFHYGNVGLQIAAAIIEKISSKSFETLFQERIARPCEMGQTDFGNKDVPLAAGDAWSTASDYMHFLQMLLNKGTYNGKKVLSEKSVAAMQVNYAKNAKVAYSPATTLASGYGFGTWVITEASGNNKGAVSSPGLFGSFPWVDYEKGYCATLFTFNLKNKGRQELYNSLKDLVDKELQ